MHETTIHVWNLQVQLERRWQVFQHPATAETAEDQKLVR